jgi:hypothetical protein
MESRPDSEQPTCQAAKEQRKLALEGRVEADRQPLQRHRRQDEKSEAGERENPTDISHGQLNSGSESMRNVS